MGARGGCRTGSRTPGNATSTRTPGLRLMRLCGASARTALPGQRLERQELRFARLAGRKDGRAGYRFPPSTRTARPQCPLPTRPPSRQSVRGSQLRSGPCRLIRSSRQKAGVGEARPDLSSWCVRVGGSGLPLPGRPPARRGVPTSIHFCASGEGGLGGGSGCRAGASRPRTGQAICEAPRPARAPGRRDEDSATAAAAAGARSPPSRPARSHPGPPRPRAAQVPEERRAAADHAAAAVPRAARLGRAVCPRGSARPGAASSLPPHPHPHLLCGLRTTPLRAGVSATD